ncbi:hypothetical protein DUF2344 [Gottschalkia acidurici 9a]|uniref:DUF2344 domain-containing protein n=1 Tax=Gottschalkia acidurici (strain ATCC 7906 / DSM 604 / BCRC 14475 / CIP 104303 / KCTC 5404 / NCIMB 10678 / 9a) TaxID=1128398 RepID=K0B2Z2_GOTA9|nr:TIGR03936 family radical SAM-associated protein [Gottschalkia acidurici]AFS78991.1 hypothetical protein DUF2344 [Gottschalkia acidurici 9a]
MINIRAKFTKQKNSKYISHLDLMRLFQRAFRRAGILVKHTEGFNPQPKLAFATALSLGVSSEGEYMDVELENSIEVDEFINRTNSVLPEGVKIVKAAYKEEKESIMSLIRWGSYIVEIELINDIDNTKLESEIQRFLSLEEIPVMKERKRKKKIEIRQENIKDKIKDIKVLLHEDKRVVLKTTLMTGSNGNLKPELLLEAIDKYSEIKINSSETKIHRLELFIEQDGNVITPI